MRKSVCVALLAAMISLPAGAASAGSAAYLQLAESNPGSHGDGTGNPGGAGAGPPGAEPVAAEPAPGGGGEPAPPPPPPVVAAPPAPPPLPPPAAPTPPPLPVKPTVTYYVERGGQPFGPLTLDQIGVEIKEGRVTKQTLVWKSGDPAWVAAGDAADLKQLFAAMPPPIPPETQWKQFMVGTWQAVITNPQGMQGVTETVTIQYRPDGSFAGLVTFTMQGLPGSNQPVSGTWSVQALGGADQFTLTTSGAGGQQTGSFRRIDDNTVVNDQEGYQVRRIGG